MNNARTKILSVAGFDPSGGAGILADIKTFEAHRCMGFAVNTANTIQNEREFITPNWIDEKEIFNQANILLKNYQFSYVKIGLIPSLGFLKEITEQLSKSKLIWDPVLSASAGFNFDHDLSQLKEVLKGIYMITPNWNEVKELSGNKEALKGAEELSELTNVYLKGGHNDINHGKDYLFFEAKKYSFNPKNKKPVYPKHGSGCVFSSALTANLAKGFPMIKACLRSKQYIEKYLASSTELLGYHNL